MLPCLWGSDNGNVCLRLSMVVLMLSGGQTLLDSILVWLLREKSDSANPSSETFSIPVEREFSRFTYYCIIFSFWCSLTARFLQGPFTLLLLQYFSLSIQNHFWSHIFDLPQFKLLFLCSQPALQSKCLL